MRETIKAFESGEVQGTDDKVNHPGHYTAHYPFECIDLIRKALTAEQFEGYCLGNELKYRLRAGFKGDASEDIGKAIKYNEFRKEQIEGNIP